MKKSEIINQIIDGITYANGAIPCIGIISMFILLFINVDYAAIFGLMLSGAYCLEVLIAIKMMSSLYSLKDKMEENEEN